MGHTIDEMLHHKHTFTGGKLAIGGAGQVITMLHHLNKHHAIHGHDHDNHDHDSDVTLAEVSSE